MILGIFPEQGGSIAGLARTGQDSRFIHSYLGKYTQAFDKVFYFSYADENPDVPDNCYVIPNPGHHRWIYTFLLPTIQRQFIEQCDVLRVMQAYGAMPAAIAKSLYGIPYVATYGYRYFKNVRAQGMGLPRACLFRWRARLGARLADKVIVTTKDMYSYVSPFLSESKILIVPNGVDTTLFQPIKPSPNSLSKTVIFVGRLSPIKNLFMLIDAIALIRHLEIKLVLVGDGPLRDDLKAHASQKNVMIDFRGLVPHHELPSLLGSADVFALPSLTEGHPKALLEAMSCALPCVGTKVPGIQNVLCDGITGLLCEMGAQDLANKLAYVLSNPALAATLGSRAREYVVEGFDLGSLLEKEIGAMKQIARSK
jgi:glycosyltransferase involved in cell wall biosynthesis